MEERKAKQVIVIRSDLRMRRGKEIAQGAHAAMAWLSQRMTDRGFTWSPDHVPYVERIEFSEAEHAWLNGSFAKVTCRVRSEEELGRLYLTARNARLHAHVIVDAGRTEFHGEKTVTALAIGPDWADVIDPVTGHLELY
jgi:PTH2 family peptidyl-tRNA hydrolase